MFYVLTYDLSTWCIISLVGGGSRISYFGSGCHHLLTVPSPDYGTSSIGIAPFQPMAASRTRKWGGRLASREAEQRTGPHMSRSSSNFTNQIKSVVLRLDLAPDHLEACGNTIARSHPQAFSFR